LFIGLFCCSPVSAEDVLLREQAIQLLERANSVSLLAGSRDYEQSVNFSFHDLSSGQVTSGTLSRISAGTDGRWEEIVYGNYHASTAIAGNQRSTTKIFNEAPEITELLEQLPIYLGRFDDKDVIRSIEDTTVGGHAARCINFDTHLGSGVQVNQICVDSGLGTLLRWHAGDDLIENSDFFQIGRLWEPGTIRHYVQGALRVQIEQRIVRTPSPVDVKTFSPPSGEWNKWWRCDNYRRPLGIYMPMPPPGSRGIQIVDVVVRVFLSDKGVVDPRMIVSSTRPDLNDEAMKLVGTWRFDPQMCNDQVASTVVDLVVHFQGR
jgi:TonB family protein